MAGGGRTSRQASMDDIAFYLVDGIYLHEWADDDVETDVFN